MLALFALAWVGADWATRAQYVIMGVLVIAMGSFFVGAYEHAQWTNFAANLSAPKSSAPFWIAFAVFFPAVTGFTQGASMSGDLADANRSIPIGTFAAVGISIAIYLACAVLLAAGERPEHADPRSARRCAASQPGAH